MTKEEILKIAEQLYQRAIEAKSYFSIINQYAELIHEYKEEIEISEAFHGIVHSALTIATFMEIAKLYERSNKINSIHLLMKHCTDYSCNDIFFSNKIKEFRKQLNSYNAIIENIRNQRNKFYAHNDMNHLSDFEKLYIDFPIKKDHMLNLIDFALDFTVFIITTFDELNPNRIVSKSFSNIDDLKNTLFYVRSGLEKQEEQIQSILGSD